MSVEYIFSIAGVFTVAHIYIYIYTYIWTRRAANVSISQHALEVDARTEKGEKKSGGQVSSE